MSQTAFYPSLREILNNRYEVTNILATGGTAIILECLDQNTGRKVVVKRFFPEKMTKHLEEKIATEPKINLQSQFLVKGEEAFYENNLWHLAMPFVEGEPLRDIINLNKLPELNCAYTVLCICKGTEEFQSLNLALTDIKPSNTMMLPDGRIQLIDLTCWEYLNSKATISKGTPPYSAPELVKNEILYPSTDIYSIGMVLMELLVGVDDFTRITSCLEINIGLEIKPDISELQTTFPEAAKIIDKAIEPNPAQRHSNVTELLQEVMLYYNKLTGHSAPVSSRLVLVCSSGKTLSLQPGKVILGRKEIDPQNVYISEKHIEIEHNDDNIMIRDAGSINKPMVNNSPIGGSWINLSNGDIIQLANVILEVRIY